MTLDRSLLQSLALGAIAAGSLGLGAQGAAAAPGRIPPAAAASPPPVAAVSFAGYDWAVKAPTSTWGPGPNWWSANNVSVDAAGRLHLKITQRRGQWYCAEVTLGQELGYGTYRFSVDSSLGSLDPNVILGMFTWSDDPAQNDREMDIEISRWGSTTDPTNAQYVVQPAGPAGHLTRFTQPATPARSVQSFTWLPGQVDFATTTAAGVPIAHTDYVGSDVPTPGSERVHINLWLYGGQAPTSAAGVEVTLAGFSFVPATTSDIATAAVAPPALFGIGLFGPSAGTIGSSETASAELGV
ncbi:MAG TPA: glycoside hydrolase family 16 protein [Solirubrobacteraceae bacterium]|jgi:hypothetical protein|nr:glycoside hydrolase family 16 protein [Solirubrobacteraceae bacterium]